MDFDKGPRVKLLNFTKIIFFLSFNLVFFKVEAKVIEKIHAVVNGEIITLTEINDYQAKLKNGGFLNDLLFSDPVERDKAIKSRDYLLKLLIDEKIIDFEVKQNSLLVTDERVNKEISTIAQRQNMNMAQMKQALKDQGIDYDEYHTFVKQSIERRQLVEKEITSKIKISEQDIVSDYLAKSQSSKKRVFEFNLSHILFSVADQKLANEVSLAIKNGASFESYVKKHSRDDDSKDKDGVFGTFTSGEMISSIENSISNLEIGQSTSVVKTPMGLHIFKVMDKKLVKDPDLEKKKQDIYQQLFAKEFKEQLEFWLLQKRKDAIIQINPT